MASAGNINITTSVSTAGLTSGLDGATASIDRAAASMEGAGAKAGRMGAGFKGASGGIRAAAVSAVQLQASLALVAVPLAAIAGVSRAVGRSMEIEDRVVKLANAANLAGPEIGAMRDEILALGTSVRGVGTDGLFDAATAGAKMGVASDQVAEFARGVGMASLAIDDMPIDELSTAFGRITNNFGLDSVEGLKSSASAVDGLADSFATSASEIINVTTRLSGTADSLGLTAHQTAALAATITAAGVRSEQASGSLGRLLQGMIDASTHADFGRVLGVSAEEFAATLAADPMEAIDGFLGALSRMDAASSQLAMRSVGITGSEDIGVVQLLANSYESLGKAVEIANHQFATQEKLQQSYETHSAKTSSQIQQLGNVATRLASAIGRLVMPVVNQVLKAVNLTLSGVAWLIERVAGALERAFGWVGRQLGLIPEAADETEAALDQVALAVEQAIPHAADLADELGRSAEGIDEAADRMGELRRRAESVFEATRTPIERLDGQVADLREMLTAGLIDPDTYVRAVEQARSALGPEPEKAGRPGLSAALSYGSAEARSLLLSHRQPGGDEHLRLARESVATEKRMLHALVTLPGAIARPVPVRLQS